MTSTEVSWSDLCELHVVKRLGQIVERRLRVDVGYADARGALVGGQGSGACAREAATVCAGANTPLPITFECSACRHRTLAAPVVIDGLLLGCVFAAAAAADDGLLAELLELSAAEMVTFAVESQRRDRRGSTDGQTFTPRYPYADIIGRSRPMQDLYRVLDKVIESDATVLVNGENGTGKELIARAIHYNSRRAGERFVVQNCSAFNDNLLDSELFGHKKGAFTGAIADKQGLFEVADRGTFFLDEIADMSPALQVKVLRVLQEGTFTPVGDTGSRTVDVRIIAASNRELKRMVEKGEFREDLYYRINVIQMTVPPLRERREDLPLLVDHFLNRNAKGRRLKAKRLTKSCMSRLLEYAWPGNIRELENEIERLVVLAGDEKLIGEELLSTRMRDDVREEGGPRSLPAAVDALERNLIYEVLKRTHWNKTKAAEELRISRRNLIRKVNKYKLDQRRLR
ncbi:MAG: nitrogen fixation protein NifA [Myxococcales bacterium]|nr:nitrogen fixation protein NifA [Myxococcales bacterium]